MANWMITCNATSIRKRQSRRNNDVGVHHYVAIERHFSDTIRRPFAHSLRKDKRELIKTVAIDWSSFSVRGRLSRRRTGISSIKFASLCQSCGFNRSARCPALLHDQIIDASSNPERLFAHIHNSSGRSQKISTNQQGQVFRRNHAENNSAVLASNRNGELLL